MTEGWGQDKWVDQWALFQSGSHLVLASVVFKLFSAANISSILFGLQIAEGSWVYS